MVSQGTAMRVEIDPERCTGHGRCYMVAPEVFEADDRGLALLLVDGDLPPDLLAAARMAVANCPEEAIGLHPRA